MLVAPKPTLNFERARHRRVLFLSECYSKLFIKIRQPAKFSQKIAQYALYTYYIRMIYVFYAHFMRIVLFYVNPCKIPCFQLI